MGLRDGSLAIDRFDGGGLRVDRSGKVRGRRRGVGGKGCGFLRQWLSRKPRPTISPIDLIIIIEFFFGWVHSWADWDSFLRHLTGNLKRVESWEKKKKWKRERLVG